MQIRKDFSDLHAPATRAKNGLVETTVDAALYAGLQSPLEGAVQLVNHVAGRELLPKVHLVDAPEHVVFDMADPRWYAQQLGSGLGMAADLWVMGKAFHGGPFQAAEEGMSAIGTIKRSAVAGAVYSGIFTPVGDNEDFWGARSRNALVGGATFAGLTATSFGLSAAATRLAAEAPLLSSALRNPIVNGALSGAPIGAFSPDLQSLTAGKGLASGQERFESAFTFAVVGAGIGGLEVSKRTIENAAPALKGSWSRLAGRMQEAGARLMEPFSPEFELAGFGGLRMGMTEPAIRDPNVRMQSLTGDSTGGSLESKLGTGNTATENKAVTSERVNEVETVETQPEATDATEPTDTVDYNAPPKDPLDALRNSSHVKEASDLGEQVLAARKNGKVQEADEMAQKALEKVGVFDENGITDAIERYMPERPWSLRKAKLNTGEPHEQVIEVISRALGDNQSKLTSALEKLIETHTQKETGEYLDAVHRKLIEIQRNEHGSQSPLVADSLMRYSDYQAYYGNWLGAGQSAGEAAAIRRAQYGATSLEFGDALLKQGTHLDSGRKFDLAEQPLREALSIFEENVSTPNTVTAEAMNKLADVLAHTYRRPEAEQLSLKAIETAKHEPDARDVLRSAHQQLAEIYLHDGRVADSLTQYQRSLSLGYRGMFSSRSNYRGPATIDDAITASSNPYLEAKEAMDTLPDINRYSARGVLVKKYSWAVPNEEALTAIAAQGPIVEIGAGTGYWSALLKARGVDVKSFDIAPIGTELGKTNHYHGIEERPWTEILQGDESTAAQYPDRTLFLSWPVYDEPVAFNALSHFKGDKVIYIGEGIYGCTGDEAFHKLLEAEWESQGYVDIPQWDGIHDYLTIYKRKPK